MSSTGSSVTVYTTDGSQSTVPEVAGKSLQDARSTLGDAGFGSVNVSDQYAKGGKECTVAAVDPGAGTATAKSTALTLQLFGDKDGKAPKDCK